MSLLGGIFGRMRIKDPVRGTAQVVATSAYDGESTMQNVSMQLVVQGEGVMPTAVEYAGMVRASKWPQPGMTLPVTVDRADPRRLKIDWDAVPDSGDQAQASAEAIAAAMRGEGGQQGEAALGGVFAGVTPTVVDLSGDVSGLTEEHKQKLRSLGVDVDALMAQAQAAQAASAAAIPPAPPPGGADDPIDDRIERLERLAALHRQGALSDAEFEAQKRQIMGA